MMGKGNYVPKSIGFAGTFAIYSVFFVFFRDEIGKLLAEKELGDLFVIIFMQLILIYANGLPFMVVFSGAGLRVNHRDWAIIGFASNLVNYLVPLKAGISLRYIYLKKTIGMAYKISIAYTVILTLTLMFTSALICALTYPFLPLELDLKKEAMFFGLCAVVLTVLGIYAIRKGAQKLQQVKMMFSELVVTPKTVMACCFTYVLIAMLNATTYFLAFNVMDIHAPLQVIIFLAAFATISSFITLIPGNIGVTEGIVGAIMEITVGSFSAGFVGTALIRICHLISSVTVGTPCLIWTKNFFRKQ